MFTIWTPSTYVSIQNHKLSVTSAGKIFELINPFENSASKTLFRWRASINSVLFGSEKNLEFSMSKVSFSTGTFRCVASNRSVKFNCRRQMFVIDWFHLFRSAISVFLPFVTNSQVFDVKALRAFRVLRPLKLVSGVPSKYSLASVPVCCICTSRRMAGLDTNFRAERRWLIASCTFIATLECDSLLPSRSGLRLSFDS